MKTTKPLATWKKVAKKTLKYKNIAAGTKIVIIFAAKNRIKEKRTMATAIKAIPTLYGEAARRFRDMADEAEREFDERPKRDITKDPSYIAMYRILERSNLSL